MVEARSYSRISGREVDRRDDVDAAKQSAEPAGDRAFMFAVGVGVKQTDGDGLHAGPPQPPRGRVDRGRIERCDHAVGPHPLVDLGGDLGQRRRRRLLEPVEVGTGLAGQLQQVAEAAGGDQRGARAASFEKRVGRNRRTVAQVRDGARREPRLLECLRRHPPAPPTTGRAPWSRPWPESRAALVYERDVGERPAHVDTDDRRHGRSIPGRHLGARCRVAHRGRRSGHGGDLLAATAAPLLGGLVFGPRVPPVVIEIVIGILIGPKVLRPDRKDDGGCVLLDARPVVSVLHGRAWRSTFRRIQGSPPTLALVTWFMSIAIGLIARHASAGHRRGVVDSLLVGVAVTTTALGTLMPILRDNDELSTPFGTLVMGAGAVGEFGPIVLVSTLLSSGSAPRRSARS